LTTPSTPKERSGIPLQALLRLAKLIDAITEQLGKVANILVVLLVLMGFYNVVARYLGQFLEQRLTSNAVIETQWYMFSVLFYMGFAYILKKNLNVRVDFLYANWSPKRKALVDLVGTLLVLIPFCILGIYISIDYVLDSWGQLADGSWGTWEVSPDPDGLPRAPIKSMIIVGFALLMMQAVAQVIKYAAILSGTITEEEAQSLQEYELTDHI
jgi:TRAP-type mannitol/chloroaromatic compound transport system permease small subunit